MYELRNGLTHQYVAALPRYPQIFIINNDSNRSITVIGSTTIVLNTAGMVRDLENAWKRLRQELEQDQQRLEFAQQALERLPELK